VISAVRIVSIVLYLFRRNEDVLPVFSPLCIDAAINVFYFGRVAVRVVAATSPRMIRHAPCRIEFLVNELILRRMVARSVIFSVFLRMDPCRQ
jgi:hypothetical protein